MVSRVRLLLAVVSLVTVVTCAQDAGTTLPRPIIMNEEADISEDVFVDVINRRKRDAPQPNKLDKGFEYSNPDYVDGEKLFEKDIMLTPEQWQALRERKAIRNLVYRWPNGPNGYPVVPYATVSPVNVTAVLAGLQHWMDNTCIKFTPVTNTSQPYLIYFYGSGCWSYIGRQATNGQNISIGQGCEEVGTVAHETGHAMGFFHEQSRPERDSYVNIITPNIIPAMLSNFYKYTTADINDYGVLYDYTSVMHYGSQYFSLNGKLTISTVDPFAQGLIGQRKGLSHRDKLLANIMYNCTGLWLAKCGLRIDPCLNNGYTGANCSCVCPPGTTGTTCQTVTGSYYGNYISNCSRTVTQPGVITSPNYPSNYPAGSRCMYVITAPSCYYPQVTFKTFTLYGYNNYCNNAACCYFDFLEIRTTNLTNGNVYCGTDIQPGQVFTSPQSTMMLFFSTTTNFYTGWSANVSFIPITGCTTTASTTTTSTPTTTKTTTKLTTTSTPTTTTTSSTKTTITTTTTTTSPGIPTCNITSVGGCFRWTSPYFGIKNYTNNFNCSVIAQSSWPYGANITTNTFLLAPLDYVTVFLPFGRNKTYQSTSPWTLSSPTFSFNMIFVADSVLNNKGFNITICPVVNSCRLLINTSVSGNFSMFSTPGFLSGQLHSSLTQCEWWIVAPVGRKILIGISMSIYSTTGCTQDYVMVNGNGGNTYPASNSSIFCGIGLRSIITTGNTAYIAYSGSPGLSYGISFMYVVL